MSIVIREVLGEENTLGVSVTEKADIQEALSQHQDPISDDSIMVDIEGIHEIITRNGNRYMAEALRKSVPTWTKPYQKPMIMHHNEKDGKIIGRIKNVDFVKENTRSGTPALLFTSNISDKEGKEQVRDGRLSTVSIGIIAHDVRCSICGHNIAEHGECDLHDKGGIYDGERCYWDIHEFEGKELSYVIVPSDVYASNIRIYEPGKSTAKNVSEQQSTSEVVKLSKKEKSLQESKDQEVTEEAVVDEVIHQETEEEPKAEKQPEQKKQATKDKAAEDAAEKLKEVIAELNDVKNSLAEAKSELKESEELRESLEEELKQHKIAVKENLAEQILSLRESAGRKPIDKEVLLTRSEDSLKDALADLQEEMKSCESVEVQESTEPKDGEKAQGITEQVEDLENPGLTSEKDSPANVKESKEQSNISLEESFDLESLFD